MTPEEIAKKYGGTYTPTVSASSDLSSVASKYGATFSPTAVVPANTQNDYGATFPASPTDTPITAGAKATGNLPSSALGFAKGLFNTVLHPLDTLSSIGNTALGGIQKAVKVTTGAQLPQTQAVQTADQTFNALGTALKDRYGSLENLQKTATNDPFGFGTDVLSVLQGGAGVLGKTEELNSLLSKTAGIVTKPVTKIAEGTTGLVGKTAKFGVSQATGLNPETISAIQENPGAFSKAGIAENTRTNLGQSVKDTIDQRLTSLSDTGKGYQSIKETPGYVDIKPLETLNADGTYKRADLNTILKDNGIVVVDGKVKTTAESLPLNSADKTALEDFLNTYGNEKVLSNNAFLNTRASLSQLSKYDAAKTGNLQVISRQLRAYYDGLGKEQIPGLATLDAKYAPEVQQLKQIKTDYLNPNGDFKDGAINKIANLTGKGKDQILSRLEEIHPGVTQRIKILKAAEDIQNASGIKVGTYARAGGAVAGFATGNVPLIVGAILATPELAVPIIRGLGIAKETIGPIVDTLKTMANDVNNFRLPGQMQSYIQDYIKNPKLGASIEDVTKRQGGYLYHGTGGTSAEAILKEGLKPGRKGTLSLSKTEAYSKGFARDGMTPQGKTEGTMFRVKSDFLKGKTVPVNKTAPMSDQLNEILTKETIPPEAIEIYKNGKWQPLKAQTTNPLIKEAQKYKTAEEFVKAQGTPVFRGQSHEGFTAFDGKVGKQRFMPDMKGTSFSTTKESALNYGDKVIEGVIPKNQIFRSSDVNPMILNDLKSSIKNLTYEDYVDGTGFEKIVSKLAKIAESKGKTAIDLTEFFPKSKIDSEIRVLSPDAIKTKSQLTDLWNKVNKK